VRHGTVLLHATGPCILDLLDHARPIAEQRLIPDDEKLARADFAYVNDGTLEELDDFVSEVMAEVRRRAANL